MFLEETRAVVLSLHGAGVISTHNLLAEQELVLRSLETGHEAEIRVAVVAGVHGISSKLKLAVLHSPEVSGGPAIFVATRLVNIREVPEQQTFRCGVMFLPAKGSETHA